MHRDEKKEKNMIWKQAQAPGKLKIVSELNES